MRRTRIKRRASKTASPETPRRGCEPPDVTIHCVVFTDRGWITGYEEAIPINPADCDWMSQFAVSFVADIFPKTSRAGTREQWCRSGLLGRAGSNRFLRDATCRDRT